jgi:hypothetical protein
MDVKIRKVKKIPRKQGRPIGWKLSKYAKALKIALKGGIAQVDGGSDRRNSSLYCNLRGIIKRNNLKLHVSYSQGIVYVFKE